MEQNLRLGKCETDKQVDEKQYRRLIGRLLYIQATRPDITYTVNILSQFVGDPRQSHMDVADRLLGYLKATLRQGILIPKGGGINLTTYRDSYWPGCPITRNQGEKEHCTFCGKDGHNEDGCFRLIGYPDWWPRKGITEAQYQQLIKVLDANGGIVRQEQMPIVNMSCNFDKEEVRLHARYRRGLCSGMGDSRAICQASVSCCGTTKPLSCFEFAPFWLISGANYNTPYQLASNIEVETRKFRSLRILGLG
ncbi:secreted RxLR effector protein 161-like protein [Tanacetum coccineum]